MEEPQHRIRAAHSESTITVYQAYSPEIGLPGFPDDRLRPMGHTAARRLPPKRLRRPP
ncbi:hypothetical protein ACFW93_17400 [Streptomyces canus]|uniref:hypothetical protein n=1 Tax=Streptomyces canus TaxID=58343 RepID=UPI0036BB0177